MSTEEAVKTLVEQLIARGESRVELEFWLKIFPDLPRSLQKKLFTILEEELAGLKK